MGTIRTAGRSLHLRRRISDVGSCSYLIRVGLVDYGEEIFHRMPAVTDRNKPLLEQRSLFRYVCFPLHNSQTSPAV